MAIAVGPYKRIIRIHFPTGGTIGPTRYITTYAIVRPTVRAGALPSEQVWEDPILPWDGIAPPYSSVANLQNISIKERVWDAVPFAWLPDGSLYFTNATVWDQDGFMIEDGRAVEIGVSISAPSMPQIYSFGQWEYASINGFSLPTPTVPVANPMGLNFYSDASTAHQIGTGFNASPAVQYYQGGTTATLAEMATAMQKTTSGAHDDVCPLNMGSVTATYDGQTYTAIGWQWLISGFTLQPEIRVLLKTVDVSA